MAVHRRQLPLAYRCEGFAPAPGSTGDGGFCERCQKQVHDVSAMRESELRRLLAAHAGGTVCLAYRVDEHGRVRLRREPAPVRRIPLVLGTLALLLAACAGHATELEIPGATCRDEDGYVISCPEWSDPDMVSVPEADRIAAREVEDPPSSELDPSELDPRELSPVPLEQIPLPAAPPDAPTPVASAPEATEPETAIDMETTDRVSTEVDYGFTRGVVIVVETSYSYDPLDPREAHRWRESGYVPTAELIEEARARRAERKAARRRWRAARRREAAAR